jgi:predicted HicB family RNase H-like nuclease
MTITKEQQDVLDQITIVQAESGEVVAVTLTDEEHQILKVIWQKEDKPEIESTKDEIELNLEVPMLYNLMLAAHQQDITLNQLVEKILKDRIKEVENE